MMLEKLIEQAQTIAPAEIPQFLGTLETARAHALMRLQAPAPSVRPEDRLIGINAAASLLSLSTSYLYQHSATLPFTVRVGKKVLFSTRGIQEYVQKHQTKRR